MVDGMRLMWRIFHDAALAAAWDEPLRCGKQPLEQAAMDSDTALAGLIRNNCETLWHPVGTTRMGPEGDRGAVVDQYCRVRGTEGLRVVDASVMPNIVRANTNLTCIMIGERAPTGCAIRIDVEWSGRLFIFSGSSKNGHVHAGFVAHLDRARKSRARSSPTIDLASTISPRSIIASASSKSTGFALITSSWSSSPGALRVRAPSKARYVRRKSWESVIPPRWSQRRAPIPASSLNSRSAHARALSFSRRHPAGISQILIRRPRGAIGESASPGDARPAQRSRSRPEWRMTARGRPRRRWAVPLLLDAQVHPPPSSTTSPSFYRHTQALRPGTARGKRCRLGKLRLPAGA